MPVTSKSGSRPRSVKAVQMMETENYGEKFLWNRRVLSLEKKTKASTDGESERGDCWEALCEVNQKDTEQE